MAKKLARQDRNGSRTPKDLEQRYRFGEIELTAEELEALKKSIVIDSALSVSSTNPVQNKVVTQALNNKVNAETGKGLSTNDFTTEEKNKLDGLADITVDSALSTVSTNPVQNSVITEALNDKVDEEAGKGLSTNDFTNADKSKLDDLSNYDDTSLTNRVESLEETEHTHTNKTVLDGITSTKVAGWDTAKTKTDASLYNLSNYKVSDLTILRGSCIKKNNRVCVNFVGTIPMAANTTTTLFNFPAELQPTETKDFVLFGSTSNNDGYIGYGYLTAGGLLQVRFAPAISSYIRFSFVYDLD